MRTTRTPGAHSLDLSKITSVDQLAQLLAPFFLSSSLGTAPNAQGTSGNRVTVLTTQSQYARTVNRQSGNVVLPQPFLAAHALVAGTYAWSYAAANFQVAPIVFFAPVGAPPSAGTTLYLAGAPSATTATITSTDATDVRVVQLAAFPNPN